MRIVDTKDLIPLVRNLAIETNYQYAPDMSAAVQRALSMEESPIGCHVLQHLLDNSAVACRERIPICQDTGYAVLFVDVGQDVQLVGPPLRDALNEGVRQGYREGFLRSSIVRHPLQRVNTGDNTPAIIYMEIVPGDRVRLSFLAKGAGCDNVSRLAVFTPDAGQEAIEEFVVRAVSDAGPNASPPFVIGVGLGGTFELAALMAKRALTRPVGQPHPDPPTAQLEQRLLDAINRLGIGPAGFGGRVTALAVHVETFATHIASLPVAVNFDCHSHRCAHVEV